MLQTLSSCFSRKAGAVFLAGVMLGSAAGCDSGHKSDAPEDDRNISVLVPEGQSCVFLDAALHPKTPVERYFARQYAEVQKTKTGRLLFNASQAEPLRVCYDRALDKENGCGAYRAAEYNGIMKLNPAPRVSDSKRTFAMVHEMRHHFQGELDLDYSLGSNVPERARVVMYWLIEADARVAALLYAHEQAENGDDSYLRALNQDQKMIDAFYETLNPERTNVTEAARAAMLAFLQQKYYTTLYANLTLDWVDSSHKGYDPNQLATPFLVTGTLLKMGEIGYGNYMTEEVIDTFNKAFSPEDYQALKAARTLKGGRTCSL